jgi:hypothetical protein
MRLQPSKSSRIKPALFAIAVTGMTLGVAACGSSGSAPTPPPSSSRSSADVVGTWKGSYLGCTQGATGLRLVIMRERPTGNLLKATFSFYPLPGKPAAASGSYTMTGSYSPGRVALYGRRWIHHPSGYILVNLVGKPPPPGGNRFSGTAGGCSTFSLKRG